MSMHKGVTMAMHFRQHHISGYSAIVQLLLEKGADSHLQS
jgi:hypothetical protein